MIHVSSPVRSLSRNKYFLWRFRRQSTQKHMASIQFWNEHNYLQKTNDSWDSLDYFAIFVLFSRITIRTSSSASEGLLDCGWSFGLKSPLGNRPNPFLNVQRPGASFWMHFLAVSIITHFRNSESLMWGKCNFSSSICNTFI